MEMELYDCGAEGSAIRLGCWDHCEVGESN